MKLINKNTHIELPLPSSDQLKHSELLTQEIFTHIKQNDNWLSFADYMHYALYHPLYGYYTSGNRKIGEGGDFITAPELGPLFAYGITQQIIPILQHRQDFNILEFGAGTGQLAVNILLELNKANTLPKSYYILEISAELKDRQQQAINKLPDQLKNRVKWLNTLPDDHSFQGIILANEVVDAIPVNLFQYSKNKLTELGLTTIEEKIVWQTEAIEEKLEDYIEHNIVGYLKNNGTLDYYISEVNLLARDWLASVSQCLAQGLIMLIDYGFPRHEYYHPDRNQGTLMCHYRHYAHQDPLLYPGLQDITAHVDFTSLAEIAVGNDLEVACFLSQANFLLANKITDYIERNQDNDNIFSLKQQLKKLTSPSEMGELFKFLMLSRNLDDKFFQHLQSFDKRGFL